MYQFGSASGSKDCCNGSPGSDKDQGLIKVSEENVSAVQFEDHLYVNCLYPQPWIWKKGKDQPVTNMFCSRDSLELRNEPLFIMASAQPAAYSKSLKYK